MSEVFLNINKQPIFGRLLPRIFSFRCPQTRIPCESRRHFDSSTRARCSLWCRCQTVVCEGSDGTLRRTFCSSLFCICAFSLCCPGSNGALPSHHIVDGALVSLCDRKHTQIHTLRRQKRQRYARQVLDNFSCPGVFSTWFQELISLTRHRVWVVLFVWNKCIM